MNNRLSRARLPRLLCVAAAVAALAACGGKDAEQLVASAKSYLAASDLKAATIELKSALQKQPDSGEARFLLGKTLLDSGDASGAAVELRKASDNHYADAEVVPLLARALLAQGQSRAVVDRFATTTLADASATASLKTTLAAAYAAQGDTAKANAALGAALAADPQYAPAQLQQARQAAGKGHFDEALAQVEQVLARSPSDAQAWFLKGDLLARGKHDMDGGLAAYRKAASLDKRSTAAPAAIVMLHLARRDVDAAAKEVADLKQAHPSDPTVKYLEGQVAYAKGDIKTAAELSAQLLKIAPENLDVLQLAGAVELRQRSFVRAEALLQKALALAPQRRAVRVLLAQTFVASGQSTKALSTLSPLLDDGSDNPAVLALAGQAELQRGDIDDAQAHLAKAVALNPDDTRSRTVLAMTRLSEGDAAAFDTLRDIAASDKGTTADTALIAAHLRSHQFPQALKAVESLERKLAGQPLPAYLRGMVHLAMKQPDTARQDFEQALSRDAAYFPAAARLAEMDLRDDKPDAAKARFDKVLQAKPHQMEAMLALARLRAHQHAPAKEVAGLLADAVKHHPAEAAPRLQLIQLYLAAKDYPQALTAAQDAAARLPDSAPVLEALGRAQLATGDTNQAINSFNKLVALQPGSPLGHVRLADTYMLMKDPASAAQSLRRALQIKPDLLEVQGRLFALELGGGHVEQALEIARTVQKQRPREATGHALEGEALATQKHWDAAATAFRAGFDMSDGTKAAVGYYGLQLKKGDPAAAGKFADRWLADHPKDATFLRVVAQSSLARKDYAAAEARFRKLLALDPNNVAALNNLAWALTQGGKPGAVPFAEKANELQPNVPAMMETLALALAADKQVERAVELQRKAVSLDPDTPSLRLNLARLYVQAGQKSQARTELEKLAKVGEGFKDQSEVKKLLQSL